MNLLNFLKDTITNGGATFNLLTGEYNPKTGYMVATSGHELIIPIEQFNQNTVAKYISEKSTMLMGGITNDNYFLGSWVDGEKVYLDISEKIDDLNKALLIGSNRKQLAIWDNSTMSEIRL